MHFRLLLKCLTWRRDADMWVAYSPLVAWFLRNLPGKRRIVWNNRWPSWLRNVAMSGGWVYRWKFSRRVLYGTRYEPAEA